jgi:micrococcal nuclease
VSIKLTLSLIILLAILVLALAPAPSPTKAQRQSSSLYTVVDGDTIRSPAGVSYRLMGYDTPETYQAKCREELTAGLKAKARLEDLIASGETRLIESGKIDRYGRSLARLEVNGVDVAKTLIAEGHARPYTGRTKREGWCA